jgi:hypothetical protein
MALDLYAHCDGDELGALEAIFSGLRWYAAASGAMRYPWSQEFAIEAITEIRGR